MSFVREAELGVTGSLMTRMAGNEVSASCDCWHKLTAEVLPGIK